ncbi:unnamed protein product, partial [Oppiella nova]
MAGALLFSIQWYHTIGCQRNKSYTADDTHVMNGMFGLCVNCLVMSTLFHTFQCHSRSVIKIFSKLDYLGIALVLNMAQISWLYYGFYDDFMVRKVYISISLFLGGVLISVTLLDRFSESYFRRYRAIIFLSKGFYVFIPFFHFCYHSYYFEPILAQLAFKSLYMTLLSACVNLFGTLLYMYRLPERLSPGTFDYWFQSHQLFHVLNIFAALIHIKSITMLADVRI